MTEDAWPQIVARAQAIWARNSDLPFHAASVMDRLDCEDKAIDELIDEGVYIQEVYRHD